MAKLQPRQAHKRALAALQHASAWLHEMLRLLETVQRAPTDDQPLELAVQQLLRNIRWLRNLHSFV